MSKNLSNAITKRDLCNIVRYDLASFVKKSFSVVNPSTPYQHNWHIDIMADYLVACEKGDIRRLIINMPPRYLKSLVTSVSWPAWLLGQDPSRRIIVSSYSQGLANKHSMDCRLIMEQPWYKHTFPELHFTHDQNEKHKFVTTQRGFRMATSTGGTVTGEGGNFLIVDDIHNPINIFSDAKRSADISWFEHVFSSRLDDKKKGVFLIIMQRLHEEDLTGHLLKKQGWEILSLPAVSEKRTIIGYNNHVLKIRNKGELLQQEREGPTELKNIQSDLGNSAYLAQYQQHPIAIENNLIQITWFNRYDTLPDVENGYFVQSWDTAIKGLAQHDYTVCTTWYCNKNAYYLVDIIQEKMEYPDLKKMLIHNAERWKPFTILIEDKASGQSLIQDIKKETTLPIKPIMPRKDKVTRLIAVTALIEAGHVWLPKKSHWLDNFEIEVLKFPQSKHDDQVDSMSQFLNWVREKENSTPQIRKI